MAVYDFTVKDNKGNDVSMSQYKGKVLLILNTATKCGLTPQYEKLEAIYKEYHDKGLEILDFPCNQFLGQAPGTDEEIDSFCRLTYSTTFPRFAKIDVNGKNAHPLFSYLKKQAAEIENEHSPEFIKKIKDLVHLDALDDIKWNFTKFLVDKEGKVVSRFSPTVTPDALKKDIEKLLQIFWGYPLFCVKSELDIVKKWIYGG